MLKINPTYSEMKSFHLRSDVHLLRRLWHIGSGICGLLAHFKLGLSTQTIANILFALGIAGLIVELSRMYVAKINVLVMKLMGPFMRENEKDSFSGFPFYALGVALALTIFEDRIAILAILFLIFSDPVSSIFGVLYGRDKILPNKSLQGATAGFVTCYLLSLGYGFTYLGPSFDLLTFSIFSGAIGMGSELISGKIDDNLTIPVVSGAGLTALNLFIPLY